MKRKEITVTGAITCNGSLKMYMGELNEFFKDHKGSKVIARFTVVGKSPSEAMKGYYFNYIVPEIRNARWTVGGERTTEKETELFLRQLSPVTIEQIPNIETGQYETNIREIRDLSTAEMSEHMEFIKQMAAEEYGVYIEDPK